MADVELVTALKQAKSKKMFFAFVPKGTDGKLIVRKARIPPKEIAEAKKELGGGTPITGKCIGDGGTMVFQVAKPQPPTLTAALKRVIRRDSGLSLEPDVQVAGDADAEEESTGTSAPENAAATPQAAGVAPAAAASAAAPKAGGDPKILGIQKALQQLGLNPGAIDGINGPKTQAAVKEFQKSHGLAADGVAGPKTQAALAQALKGGAAPAGGAPADGAPAGGKAAPDLGPWQTARQAAVTQLKALAAKVAGTKHGSAKDVLVEINNIITKLPAIPKLNELDKLEAFIRDDDAITAAEESPKHFHALEIRKPLLEALEALKQ